MVLRDGILVFARPGAIPASALDKVIADVRALDMAEVRREMEARKAAADLKRELDVDFDAALAKLPPALEAEGFGIITRTDLKDVFQKKLGADFRRYQILGACDPQLALRALEADLDVGVMLPCNVAVYESDGGKAVVTMTDPLRTIAAENAALRPIAEQVRERLARVLAAL